MVLDHRPALWPSDCGQLSFRQPPPSPRLQGEPPLAIKYVEELEAVVAVSQPRVVGDRAGAFRHALERRVVDRLLPRPPSQEAFPPHRVLRGRAEAGEVSLLKQLVDLARRRVVGPEQRSHVLPFIVTVDAGDRAV